jgi:glycosyltransferase involved in cell wall biosynthesis
MTCIVLPFLLLGVALRLRRAVRRADGDVVVSNGIKCHALSPLAVVGTGARLVWHVRDVVAPGLTRWCLRLGAWLFCDLVITNSSAVADTVRTGKTATIHNGIDLDVFRPDLQPLDKLADLGVPPDARVIGTVGHLAPLKGLDTLIDAAPAVLAEVPDAHFVIVGAAIYESHRQYERLLRQRVEAAGLGRRVHFLGFSDDVPRLLATFDAFVLCSRSEGFGRAVAEALAAGCPAVCTAVGGVVEICRHGVDGLLVPPDRPEALVRGLVRLMTDAPLRHRLTASGLRRVRERFSLERQAELFRQAIRAVRPDRRHAVASVGGRGATAAATAGTALRAGGLS